MVYIPADIPGLQPIALAIIIGGLPLAFVLFVYFRRGAAPPPESMPADGVWDLKTLARFDGLTNPICMGVCGHVVDVSESENIKHGEGYGKIWAGRDATYSLATLSLKIEDANNMDFKLPDFTPDQHKALAGWYKHFTTKYKVVGRLIEYDGWDFTSVKAEAKSQTPFGAGGIDINSKAAAEAGAAQVAETAETKSNAGKAKEEPAFVISKGLGVLVEGIGPNGEKLDGSLGIVEGYNATLKGFEVRLEKTGKMSVYKPSQLSKA